MRIIATVFLALLVLLGLVWSLLFFVTPKVLPTVFDRAMPRVNAQLAGSGMEVSDWTVGKIRLAPTLTELQLDAVGVQFDLRPGDGARLQSQARARRATFSVDPLSALQGTVTVEGIVATIDPADLPPGLPFDRISNGTLRVDDLPVMDPGAVVEELRQGLADLMNDNQLSGKFEFEADVILRIDGVRLPARLYTERQGEEFRLRFLARDIVNLSRRMKLDLSPEQLEVVSLYPLRLVDLVQITEQARDRSGRRFRHDRWKQDALRHVTWSFLLADRFGPEFAAEVTNAYETRPGNEADERLMDYHNNAVGRLLQSEGVALNDLPERVRTDRRVIVHPSRVQHWPDLLR